MEVGKRSIRKRNLVSCGMAKVTLKLPIMQEQAEISYLVPIGQEMASVSAKLSKLISTSKEGQ